MGRAAAWLALFLVSCTTWSAPTTPPLRGGDDRRCGQGTECADLVVVLDTSTSTGRQPGSSRWTWGARLEAEPGTILWREVEGVLDAVRNLDRTRRAIGIVGFAGLQNDAGAAWVEAYPTNDPETLVRALERLRARGASGGSCASCGVERAARLLAAAESGGRCSSLVLLTDGAPTLPYGPAFDRDNARVLREGLDSLPASVRKSLVIVENADGIDPTLLASPDVESAWALAPGAIAEAIESAFLACGR